MIVRQIEQLFSKFEQGVEELEIKFNFDSGNSSEDMTAAAAKDS
jgi:hypothetical protein